MVELITEFEPRLHRRYQQLVMEHLSPAQKIAAGLRALPDQGSAFASTQAAWRFYANERVTQQELIRPILEYAQQAVQAECKQYALCLHDWSPLYYGKHNGKQDRIQLGKKKALGYELQTSLVISDQNGNPLAPLSHSLFSSRGINSTRTASLLPDTPQIDEVGEAFATTDGMNFSVPIVHIIDRGGDSIFHYRQWQTQKALWIVRADKVQNVEWRGEKILLRDVPAKVQFRFRRKVKIKGIKARQYVAETEVIITRAARPHRRQNGEPVPRRTITGEAVRMRLIVSQVRDKEGRVLSEWLLYSNLESEVAAQQIALWYYWRWRIESYFKLMKSAGQNLEQWQQETPHALLKRLIVASMACVVVWQIARAKGEEAEEFRRVLIRLSGRQMKWGVSYTYPALLAGLWSLLAMLDVLQHYEVNGLRQMAKLFLPDYTRFDKG